MMHRRQWVSRLFAVLAFAGAPLAFAADEAPDVLVQRISGEVMAAVKADAAIQKGDVNRIMVLVDSKIMPNVNFARMTASAVGRFWRQATPAQQKQLQDEFKTLLVRTYSGALTQVRDQTVQLRPLRARPDDEEVVVRTEVRGRGDPIQLDYRLEKTPAGWKIYDVNVLGVWLADTSFKSQFAPVVASSGIDGLISTLADLNRKAGARN